MCYGNGVLVLKWPKTVACLNTSVLTKMPRDCTAPATGGQGWTVPLSLEVSRETTNEYSMARRNNNSNNTNAGSSGAGSGGSGQTKSQKRRQRRRANKDGGGPPTAIGAGGVAESAGVTGGPRGSVRFTNREYVADVTAGQQGTAGPIISFAINPTNPNVFPWLSRIATGYELYRFRRLVITYSPTCSTTTAGLVVGAFDYDATDAPPGNKQVLSGYDGARRGNVWNRLVFPAKPMGGWYYTGTPGSSVSNPVGTDLKMYDLGKFYLGVYNQTSALPMGELTVEYDVEFARPDAAILSGLSEKIVMGVPTVNDVANSPTVTGNNVFTVASTGTRQMTLTAQTPGDYALEMIVGGTNPDGAPLIASILQYDPNSSTSATPLTLDSMTGAWTNSSTPFYYMVMYALSVLAGSTVVITIGSSTTTIPLLRMRVASYRRTLA